MRLLSTLASSLSVALENARLFDETKRLLAETDQRTAELAVINEIGEALAQQLDIQAIFDPVGDKIRAIFDTQVVDIALYDPRDDTSDLPYSIDRGVAMIPAEPAARWVPKEVDRDAPAAPHRRCRARGDDSRPPASMHGRARSRGWACRYWPAIGRSASSRSQNLDRDDAFSDPMNGCSRRSPRAWALRSRTPGCSTRRSGC